MPFNRGERTDEWIGVFHTHAHPLLVGRPEIRGGYASRSRYIGYTQPAYPPPPHRTGLGVGPIKFYDLYPSRISRSWPTASRFSDSALFAVVFFARPSLCVFFYRVPVLSKKGRVTWKVNNHSRIKCFLIPSLSRRLLHKSLGVPKFDTRSLFLREVKILSRHGRNLYPRNNIHIF